MQVIVRARPMSSAEDGQLAAVEVSADGRELALSEFASTNDYLRMQRLKTKRFAFDAALGPDSTQQEVASRPRSAAAALPPGAPRSFPAPILRPPPSAAGLPRVRSAAGGVRSRGAPPPSRSPPALDAVRPPLAP